MPFNIRWMYLFLFILIGAMKKCPFCDEEIQEKALKCRYCHEFLGNDLDTVAQKEETVIAPKEITIKSNSALEMENVNLN